ncbi:MAG: tyrosine-type recombinase/integrase, partial [Lachnospiraceae bacterium]|nr:tyrosine-type recombinase/integrase [Lachnospiraceae bacterium]
FQTVCGDKRPRFARKQDLIDELYDFYYGTSLNNDFSFKAIFEAALAEKERTERPKEKTIRDYYSSYKAFITDEFGAMDIRKIKPSEMKEYIQTISSELAPTKKRFYKFKGVLNLVFNYACDPERRYVDINPVPTNNRAYAKNLTPTNNKPEDKAFQPEEVELIREHLWKRANKSTYDVNAYAILFSSETGVREGEIPSLKWSDISDGKIHIHSQQNDELRGGIKVYYYNPTTKNEKGISHDGRYIPVTAKIRQILDELNCKQRELGIDSEWVFCKRNGDWTTTTAYQKSLYLLAQKLGLRLKNNHAFRISLNSYVYVPMGLPAPERAKLLGHSVETNLKHYTFARTDEYLTELRNKMDAFNEVQRLEGPQRHTCTQGYLKILPFKAKEKSPKTANLKAFY